MKTTVYRPRASGATEPVGVFKAAFAAPVATSAQRLVLLAMVKNLEPGTTKSFMSVQTSCSMTLLNEKTVAAALKALREAGHISDTGERRGATGRIPVFELNFLPRPGANTTENGGVSDAGESSQKRVHLVPNGPSNPPGNTPVFGAEIPPKTVDRMYLNEGVVDWKSETPSSADKRLHCSWPGCTNRVSVRIDGRPAHCREHAKVGGK